MLINRYRVCMLVFTAAALLNPYLASAAPTLSHVQVVDITPSGFSVIWHANEASDPVIRVFSDAAGASAVTLGVESTAFPVRSSSANSGDTRYERQQSIRSLRQIARSSGLSKVEVGGLQPNTQYYLEAQSVGASGSSKWPASGLEAIRTMQENRFILDNALLVVDLGEVNAEGWIVTAKSEQAAYAVSAYAGSGASPGTAVLNMGNLADSSGRNLIGNEAATISIQVIKPDGTLLTGSVEVVSSGSFAVSSQYETDLQNPLAAQLEIVAPEMNTYSSGEPVVVRWIDELEGVNATVSLYLDTDSLGEDGFEIVSGLPEDDDGPGDEFVIDAAAVVDGSYYVYAVLSDGVNSTSAYGSSKITIDNGRIDGDGDSMSDLWELHNFDALDRSGEGDFDSDGLDDGTEYFYGANPLLINEPLAGLSLALESGTQIIGVPGMLVPRLSAFGLLEQLGSSALSISHYNAVTRVESIATLVGGVPAGDDFPLLPGEGYFVQMNAAESLVWSPYTLVREIRLVEGVNIIGFADPQGDAFALLSELGSASVSSVRRIDPLTSLSETAAFDGDQAVGISFPLQYGEGYVFTVKQETVLP